MRHLPPSVADALAAPIVRLTVGDISKLGLRKLPYGPNTQIRNDRHIPLLDIGTMDHIRNGRITVHGGIARFTPTGVVFEDGTTLDVDAVVLGTGYRPALEEFLPEWQQVCDGEGRPLVSGGPTTLPGLFFCGQFVSPSGMLREAGAESRRIAAGGRRAVTAERVRRTRCDLVVGARRACNEGAPGPRLGGAPGGAFACEFSSSTSPCSATPERSPKRSPAGSSGAERGRPRTGT